MSILTASELAKSYGPYDVFAGISFEVPHGARVALVGPNGTGKTTLLHLAAGLEEPSQGNVTRARGLRIGYLPQHATLNEAGTLWEAMERVFDAVKSLAARLRELEAAMADADLEVSAAALEAYGPVLEAFEHANGYDLERRIETVLSGLGFDPADFHRSLSQFSGGQQTRAMLARLLLEDPDLLLLDEPTNHLDLAGIEWLERYLGEWKGAVIVVAHDRAFLDAVVNQVWEMFRGRLDQYRGNYSAYVAQRAERMANQQAAYERQQEFVEKETDFIRRNIAGQRTREAKGRLKRLERMERVDKARDYRPPSLRLQSKGRSGDLVIGLYDLQVGYTPDRPLFRVEEVELRRGQRVALLGPNGTGKTTLLRTVLGQLQPLAGRLRIGASVEIAYLAQSQDGLVADKTILDHILEARAMTVGEARNLLGRYRFSGDDVFKPIEALSGGERARVALARLALQDSNLLLLDEPTNHLDIPSQEILQEAMESFGGTLLLVSHDRFLIRALATRVWAIAEGQLWEFKEGYDEYRAWAEQRRAQPGAAAEDGVSEQQRLRQLRKAEQRDAARLARRVAELEEQVHELEFRLAELTREIETASAQRERERVAELGQDYTWVEMELQKATAAWVEAAAEAEDSGVSC